MDNVVVIAVVAVVLLVIWVIARTALVVPQQSAYVVETVGRYSRTLQAGFHLLVPFVDRVAYRHTLKEQTIDIPEQVCITRDNVQVGVDGVLYLQVLDPRQASYGVMNYAFAISQLAQTTLRSEMGKIDLDRTFEKPRAARGLVHQFDPMAARILDHVVVLAVVHDVHGYLHRQLCVQDHSRPTCNNAPCRRSVDACRRSVLTVF
jgi:regulator of protease activity HflC (stomatin/prohibitin superfamily)